ncbi:MAG: hypothetical protein FIB07_16270 [Candidatus Methanoperedens sp.]|nr:hypothetical protein [Candidatus Methanoperedens sp.]
MIGKVPPVTSGQNSKTDPTVKIAPSANKDVRRFFLQALRTRAYSKNKIISFPEVKRILSWWRVQKQERDELLYDLRDEGFLEIIPFHGIRIKPAESGERDDKEEKHEVFNQNKKEER